MKATGKSLALFLVKVLVAAVAIGAVVGLACSFYPDFGDRACKTDDDCLPGDICLANRVCGPRNTTPEVTCDPGQWANGNTCEPCTVDEHCGPQCVSCASHPYNNIQQKVYLRPMRM